MNTTNISNVRFVEKFTGREVFNFMDRFKTDDDCIAYLAYNKWGNGFACPSCGHKECWEGQKAYTMVCKSCRFIESASSNTLFHKVKFGLKKAFYIAFEMSTSSKSVSANAMAERLGVQYNTAWLFMRKVRVAMESSEQHPLTGNVTVDEFVIGGYEEGMVGRNSLSNKKKVVVAVEKNGNLGINRAYAMPIDNYSAKELAKIFTKHIDASSVVDTDKWKAYKAIAGYNITQTKSTKDSFKQVHRFIQGLKSWVRGIHHSISKDHLEAYLNEYCFRFNRHQHKNTIFHKLTERLIEEKPHNRMMLSKMRLKTYEQRRLRIRMELMVKGQLGIAA
jgi:transposase-like protein/transcription elongation factor Elf1